MTNRRCVGIHCVLALTSALLTQPALADESLAAAKSEPKIANVRVPEFDLARDLSNKLVRPDGEQFEEHRLTGSRGIDYYLVFFGAHWCPNSKKFTPKLTKFYRERRSAHRNFEVIFVSADKDEDAMLHYMNGYRMPWPAVKFSEGASIPSIRALAGRGYPCVALVDARGRILAHSYGLDRKGKYVGPLQPVEKLKELLDGKRLKKSAESLARFGR